MAGDGVELVGEHELHNRPQDAVFGAENIVKRTGGHVGQLHDVGHFGVLVSVADKQPRASGQNPATGVGAAVSSAHWNRTFLNLI